MIILGTIYLFQELEPVNFILHSYQPTNSRPKTSAERSGSPQNLFFSPLCLRISAISCQVSVVASITRDPLYLSLAGVKQALRNYAT